MTQGEDRIVEMLRAAAAGDEALLLFGNEIPPKHQADWTRLRPVRPLALARPRTPEQVSAIVRICHETSTPIVPQGGLTGLVGGAHPVKGCVAISLERMAGVEEVDVEAATMVVLAGTPLEVAQNAAEAAGLMLPLDIGARGSCTIGGNLATNAGGNRVIAYGPLRDNVLGIEAVLPDGSILNSMNRLVKNNTGYDLKHLFIGSEGTLGVITRAVLRLRSRPLTVVTALCALPSARDLAAALAALRDRVGPALTAFEAMWPDFWDLVTARIVPRSPFSAKHGAYVLVELSGFDADADQDRFEAVLADLLEAGIVEDAVIARTKREAEDFWRIREAVGEVRNVIGALVSFDVGIPARKAPDFVVEAVAALRDRWSDVIHLSYGHLGDNNIHLVVRVPSASDAQPKTEIDGIVYEVVGRFGGSVSAEHGIGLTKRAYLQQSRSALEIATMRAIKSAIDPRNIMNPGKIFENRIPEPEKCR